MASAQAQIPFNLRFQQGQTLSVVADGATLNFPAEAVGMPVSGTLTVNYRGVTGTTVTINTIDLTGSLDFSVSGFTATPFNIAGGESVTLGIRYAPATANRTTARLVVNYTEGRTTGTFVLNLAGVAPDFAFSYTPPGGNAQPLVTGGIISFPQTIVDTTVTATLVILNRGSGAGVVTSVVSTGAAFQLVGAPLPGTSVDGGREVRVGIAFTPRQVTPSTGSIAIELVDRRVSFSMEGTGSVAQFAYEVITERGASAIAPEQNINLPDVLVGERSSVVVRVSNTGTADGRIAAIAVSGAGITVSDLPPLPITLAPGTRFTFTINFNPAAAGRVTGRLRIGLDQFDVTASGLGPVLSYAYLISGVSTTVANNGTVSFSSTAVGASSSVQFQISNTGTAPGSVSSVSITSAATVFELLRVPSLPVTLPPGASTTFSIGFTPTALGAATATLRLDGQTFTLNGTGTSPAPLPEYRFTGATGAQEPLQQPAVSLSLASPYPLALNGTLTLAFNSDVFSNDPAVQFATGGRTVSFTVAANTTQAIFANNSNQIRLQTGTVAGTISLTPSFATEGGINLTPQRPASLNLTVASSAPRLLSVSISARTGTSVTLLVSGYTTARSITQMDLQFTPVSGENLTGARASINVESAYLAWYQGAQSAQFGSLFTATVPVTLSGETVSATSLSDAIQSVSVTLTNRLGASPARSVDLR
jgi:hypothetical protein